MCLFVRVCALPLALFMVCYSTVAATYSIIHHFANIRHHTASIVANSIEQNNTSNANEWRSIEYTEIESVETPMRYAGKKTCLVFSRKHSKSVVADEKTKFCCSFIFVIRTHIA